MSSWLTFAQMRSALPARYRTCCALLLGALQGRGLRPAPRRQTSADSGLNWHATSKRDSVDNVVRRQHGRPPWSLLRLEVLAPARPEASRRSAPLATLKP